ncbi:MAG: acyltransferase family protein [Rhizobiaceae bacterium]
MNAEKYRPDIDGLRALCVLSILMFHLDIEPFGGGFIGVDIFFVISGFLITRLIKDEIEETKTFNFVNFYIRRARRLFPALFFTVVVCLVFAFMLFSPPDFKRFGGSAMHAITSLSNFYFWNEVGYFNREADIKPLLHTWSLAVEEQYYLLWPLILVAFLKSRFRDMLFGMLLAIGVGSLLLNFFYSSNHAAIFYLTPFRIFEFVIGAIIVWLIKFQSNNQNISNSLFIFGLVAIVYCVVTYTDKILFPSYNALLPCAGAALIIYSGHAAKQTNIILNNKIMVGIGLISYSLYLIHWPLIVFYKNFIHQDIVLSEKLSIFVISFVLAIIMYYFIEQFFRSPKNKTNQNNAIGFQYILLTLLVVLLAANIWAQDGWKWRMPTEVKLANVFNIKDYSKQHRLFGNFKRKNRDAKLINIGENPRILILGDSHAKQYLWLANYIFKRHHVGTTIFSSAGCPPVFGTYKIFDAPRGIKKESRRQKGCKDQTKIWEKFVEDNAKQYDYVILSSRWAWLFERGIYFQKAIRSDVLVDKNNPKFSVEDSKRVFKEKMAYTLDKILKLGMKPIVFGQVTNHERSLEGCDNVPRFLFSEKTILQRCSKVPKEVVLKRFTWLTKTIKEIASTRNVATVFPTDFLCDNPSKYCRTHFRKARLSDDDDHINKNGAIYLAFRWEKSAQFPFK